MLGRASIRSTPEVYRRPPLSDVVVLGRLALDTLGAGASKASFTSSWTLCTPSLNPRQYMTSLSSLSSLGGGGTLAGRKSFTVVGSKAAPAAAPGVSTLAGRLCTSCPTLKILPQAATSFR